MKKQLEELARLAPELCGTDGARHYFIVLGSRAATIDADGRDEYGDEAIAIAAITDWIKAQVFRLIITHEDGAVRWCLYYKPKWIYEVGVDTDEYKSNDEFEVAVKSAIAIAKWKKEKENE